MGLIQFPEEEEIRTQMCTEGPGRREGERAINKPGRVALEETNAAKHLALGVGSQSSGTLASSCHPLSPSITVAWATLLLHCAPGPAHRWRLRVSGTTASQLLLNPVTC